MSGVKDEIVKGVGVLIRLKEKDMRINRRYKIARFIFSHRVKNWSIMFKITELYF